MKTKLYHTSKRIINLLLLSIAIFGCQSSGNSELKIGKYASYQQSMAQQGLYWFFYGSKGSTIGDTLFLDKQNNFQFNDCGMKGEGKFKIIKDTLFLNFDSAYVNLLGRTTYEKFTDKYLIKDSETLFRKNISKNNSNSSSTFSTITEMKLIEN